MMKVEWKYSNKSPKILKRKKQLRSYSNEMKENPTKAEKLLLLQLAKKIGYYPQRIISVGKNDYIVDILHPKSKIIIEVDGECHLDNKKYDDLRTKRLKGQGFNVCRFTNEEVLNDPEEIVEIIEKITNPISLH